MAKLNESLDENKEITQEMIDKNITYLNDLLITATKKSFLIKKEGSGKKRENKKRKKEWFNKKCKTYRNNFRIASKTLSKQPFNKSNLHKFLKARAV